MQCQRHHHRKCTHRQHERNVIPKAKSLSQVDRRGMEEERQLHHGAGQPEDDGRLRDPQPDQGRVGSQILRKAVTGSPHRPSGDGLRYAADLPALGVGDEGGSLSIHEENSPPAYHRVHHCTDGAVQLMVGLGEEPPGQPADQDLLGCAPLDLGRFGYERVKDRAVHLGTVHEPVHENKNSTACGR